MEPSKIPSGINVLAGAWVLISPWLLGFWELAPATWNSVLVGAAVLLLAAGRLSVRLGAWASFANMVLGFWLLMSPWLLGYALLAVPTANHVVSGIVIGIFGLWAAFALPRAEAAPTFSAAEPTEAERKRH